MEIPLLRGGIHFCLSRPDHDTIEIHWCRDEVAKDRIGFPRLWVPCTTCTSPRTYANSVPGTTSMPHRSFVAKIYVYPAVSSISNHQYPVKLLVPEILWRARMKNCLIESECQERYNLISSWNWNDTYAFSQARTSIPWNEHKMLIVEVSLALQWFHLRYSVADKHIRAIRGMKHPPWSLCTVYHCQQ